MKGLCARCKAETTWSSIEDDGESRIRCDRCGLKAYYPWPWPIFSMMHGQSNWVDECQRIERQEKAEAIDAEFTRPEDCIAAAQYMLMQCEVSATPKTERMYLNTWRRFQLKLKAGVNVMQSKLKQVLSSWLRKPKARGLKP